jgi:RNA polymerase sigma-70 factor, ECF subfamily
VGGGTLDQGRVRATTAAAPRAPCVGCTTAKRQTGVPTRLSQPLLGLTLATEQELATFLAEVERRAYKQALFGTRDEQVALDLVQDAMLRLTESYAQRPVTELPLLFQRILQNAIRDYYRRQKVRSLWTTLLSSLKGKDDDEDHDPLDTLEVKDGANRWGGPDEQAQRNQVMGVIEAGLAALPPRQREAFLLRYWEELDVSETASVMGCSEGSVKTHCSRATHALSAFLKSRGVEL